VGTSPRQKEQGVDPFLNKELRVSISKSVPDPSNGVNQHLGRSAKKLMRKCTGFRRVEFGLNSTRSEIIKLCQLNGQNILSYWVRWVYCVHWVT